MKIEELQKYMYEPHDYTKEEVISMLESLRTDIYHWYMELDCETEDKKRIAKYYDGELNMIRICINLLYVIE